MSYDQQVALVTAFLSIVAATGFGFWQKSFGAGVFMGVVLLVSLGALIK